jgi:hypothetical protein
LHNLIISRRQMIGIVLVLLVAGCHRTTPDTAAPSREQALTPSPTLTLSPVPTAVPTATPTTTPTSTPTPTATMTPSPTATPTDLPPPTPVNELRPSRFTRVQQGVFFSQSRQVAIEFTLFTPPSYEEGTERYPVLYFLHGVSGSEILFWNAIGREVTAANGDAGAWLSQLMLDGLTTRMVFGAI